MTSKTTSPKQLWIVMYLYTSDSVYIGKYTQTIGKNIIWADDIWGNMKMGREKGENDKAEGRRNGEIEAKRKKINVKGQK
jgi:hypothetical protein